MDVAVVGAGFGGLAAAYELSKAGSNVTVLERDNSLGGLAATFNAGGQDLEKFYHHWLGTDKEIFDLIREIGFGHKLTFKSSKVGIYYAAKTFKFSSPLDLLKFEPLPFLSRLRFGVSILYSWTLKNTKYLETVTAEEWLVKVAGAKSYETVWRPLLIGKFGEDFYREVAAIWIWNKLIQRGKSRDKRAKEFLGYYQGGFSEFIRDLTKEIKDRGAEVELNANVTRIREGLGSSVDLLVNGRWRGFDKVIYTGHVPELVSMYKASGFIKQANDLNCIKYLANVCLILETTASLSDTYWLNVNDLSFPFVGIIEHTNFEGKDKYDGKHLIYLSKYVPSSHPLYAMTRDEMTDFAIPHIKRLFPEFQASSISNSFLWKADFAQPLITKNYSSFIPSVETDIPNFFLSTMAQVYPQDRGTNYAVKLGREVGWMVAEQIAQEITT